MAKDSTLRGMLACLQPATTGARTRTKGLEKRCAREQLFSKNRKEEATNTNHGRHGPGLTIAGSLFRKRLKGDAAWPFRASLINARRHRLARATFVEETGESRLGRASPFAAGRQMQPFE